MNPLLESAVFRNVEELMSTYEQTRHTITVEHRQCDYELDLWDALHEMVLTMTENDLQEYVTKELSTLSKHRCDDSDPCYYCYRRSVFVAMQNILDQHGGKMPCR